MTAFIQILCDVHFYGRQKKIPLQLGDNELKLFVFDDNLKLQPSFTTSIHVFRSVPHESSVDQRFAKLITDLVKYHNIPLTKGHNLQLDQPILKKDLYAFLLWFYRYRTPEPMSRQYDDMTHHFNYLTLYSFFPQILPIPPIL